MSLTILILSTNYYQDVHVGTLCLTLLQRHGHGFGWQLFYSLLVLLCLPSVQQVYYKTRSMQADLGPQERNRVRKQVGLGTPLVTPARTPLLLPPGTAIAPCPSAKRRQRGMPFRYLCTLHVGDRAVTALLIVALSELSLRHISQAAAYKSQVGGSSAMGLSVIIGPAHGNAEGMEGAACPPCPSMIPGTEGGSMEQGLFYSTQKCQLCSKTALQHPETPPSG